MSQLTHDLQQKEAFVLKGSLQTMTIMHLQSTNIDEVESNLNYLISQTPKFFHQLPVLLDLDAVTQAQDPIDFAQLIHTLKSRDLFLIGVRNGTPAQLTAASTEGLGILPSRKPAPSASDQALTSGKGIKASSSSPSASKIVTQPIRSGQQIHAKNGDLIILSTVSEGAEVLADGNIHIYGALRGRALAGLSGNTEARIFCQKLQAELVSIAGHYKLNEQIDLPACPQGYQVFLKDESIQFAKL